MRKIRVLHLVESLETGGMENGVVNIANHIDYSRFEMTICCFSRRGPLARRLNNPCTRLIELGYGPGTHLEGVLTLAKLLKGKSIHIVHTHGWGARSLVGFLASKVGGVPLCINGEHGMLHLRKKAQLLFQKLLVRRFDGILAVSQALQLKLMKELGLREDAITVIANGVDVEKFHGNYPTDGLKRELGIRDGDFVLSVIGTLKKEKNQRVVLQALKEMKSSIRDLKLLLIGDGPYREYLENITRDMGIAEHVIFLGVREDIPQLLSLTGVLVLSSIPDHEGMSNVILEAMASRVPVISTGAVGSRELIECGETGLLVDYNDPIDLAHKIRKIRYDSILRSSIVRKARDKVLRDHTINIMVKKYEDYYERVFSKKCRGHCLN